MHDPAQKSKPTQRNQSSEKLLNLIEAMSTLREPARLQDIARLCDMNASTALRFLTTLQSRDYVAQEIDTGRYYITFKLCALAQNIGTHSTLKGVALPFLRKISRSFSESCNLAIDSNMNVMYIEVANQISKTQTLMITQRIGTVAPLHCTGVGKLFLSEYSPSQLEQVLAVRKLRSYTPHTITDQAHLIRELVQIREQDYALDNEECELGARCIAAPIRDYTGKIIAGISVSGPTVRMTDALIDEKLPLLLKTAEQISLRMGWIKPPAP